MASYPQKVRFHEADEDNFLNLSESDIDAAIDEFQSMQRVQKAVNRKIILEATKQQIRDSLKEKLNYEIFLDWRGRLYYNAVGLSPQGKDTGRGCLVASEAGALRVHGLKHLMIGVATTWGRFPDGRGGLDKAPLRVRVKVVSEMVRDGTLRELARAARAHADYKWRRAEDPLQFVGLAADLLAAIDSGNAFAYESRVFVGYDATCSGLQILAAVTGCIDTARLVNVMPMADGSRADIYMRGGEVLLDLCRDLVAEMAPEEITEAERCIAIALAADEEVRAYRKEKRPPNEEIMAALETIPKKTNLWALFWVRAGLINRNLMKSPVMIYCYGGGRQKFAQGFREDSKAPWKACGWLASALYDVVLKKLLPKAYAFMAALQSLAKLLALSGKPISFTAADGLPFHQETFKTEKKQLNIRLPDGKRVFPVMQIRTKVINEDKQSSGISPNLVHHWDSLFLRNVIRAFDSAGVRYFFTVHDCFFLRACDWARGWKIVREVFVETFQGDVAKGVWGKIAAAAGIEVPPCPVKGPLDLREVLRSQYLFS